MCQCDNVTIGCAMIRKAMGRTMIRKVISTLAHWHIGTLFIIGILFTGCSTLSIQRTQREVVFIMQ